MRADVGLREEIFLRSAECCEQSLLHADTRTCQYVLYGYTPSMLYVDMIQPTFC